MSARLILLALVAVAAVAQVSAASAAVRLKFDAAGAVSELKPKMSDPCAKLFAAGNGGKAMPAKIAVTPSHGAKAFVLAADRLCCLVEEVTVVDNVSQAKKFTKEWTQLVESNAPWGKKRQFLAQSKAKSGARATVAKMDKCQLKGGPDAMVGMQEAHIAMGRKYNGKREYSKDNSCVHFIIDIAKKGSIKPAKMAELKKLEAQIFA